jgi:hypothetical protein
MGSNSWSHTVVATDKGFQVESAGYGTVATYAAGLIRDYYNSLAVTDQQLGYDIDGTRTLPSAESLKGTSAYNEKFVQSTYYSTSLAVYSAAESYVSKIAGVITKAGAKATIAQKVSAVEDLFGEAKTAIDTAYSTLLKNVKATGKASASTLYKAGAKTTSLTAVQSAALLSEVNGKIDAATSISEVAGLIDTTPLSDGVLFGSYNELERLRDLSYAAIVKAYTDISDDAFPDNPTADAATKKSYAATKTLLASYGITTLPYDVELDYLGQVQKATSFDYAVNETTGATIYDQTALMNAGKKAVTDCYNGIFSTLRDAIVAKYDTYINDYSTDASWRSTYHAYVVSAIDNYIKAQKAAGTLTVAGVLSTESSGGIGAIEADLVTAAHTDAQFNTARLGYVKAEYVTSINAAVKKVVDADDLYTKVITAKVGAAATDEYATLAALGTAVNMKEATVTSIRGTGSNVYDLSEKTTDYENVNAYAVKLLGTDLDGKSGDFAGGTFDTISKVIANGPVAVSLVSTVYTNALSDVKATEVPTLTLNAGNTYFKGNLSATFDGFFADSKGNSILDTFTVRGILDKCALAENWVSCVDELDAKYKAYITSITGDANLSGHATDTGSLLWNYIGATKVEGNTSLFEKIISGEITTTVGVDSLVSSDTLKDLYTGSYAALLEQDKTYIDKLVDGLIADVPENATKLTNAKAVVLKAVGSKVTTVSSNGFVKDANGVISYTVSTASSGVSDYTCKSYTSVDLWYANACTILKSINA